MVDHLYPQRRPVRIIIPMLIMLMTGLSLGAGAMTLYWSSAVNRGLKREAKYAEIAQEFKAIADKNLAAGNECLTMLKARLR